MNQEGKKKVLMFGWEFPPHISGGLGTACFGLVSGLLEHGLDVLFVVPKLFGKEDTDTFKFVDANEVEVNFSDEKFSEHLGKISYLQIHSHMVPYVSPEEFLKSKSLDVRELVSSTSSTSAKFAFTGKYGKNLLDEVTKYAVVAMQVAKDQQFDVIHAHDWLTFPAAIMAKEISGKPLVIHIHATEFDRSGEHVNQAVYDLERRGIEAADKVICVSRLTRRILIDRYGASPDKVFVVHNGVIPKPQVHYPASKITNRKIVTFLGRITFQKGPDYFVNSAKRLLNVMPNVHFVMAGSGDMHLKLIEKVAEMRMSSRFHFTGFLNYEETNALFGMTDVYVMPSVSEPFGITPLEAMRTGVPVVISKQSGVSEVLHNAVKVDFWDEQGVADAIQHLIEHPEVASKLAKEGSNEVEGLKWEFAALKVKEIYTDLIK